MKTILARMKVAVKEDSTLQSYMNARNVKTVAPRTLPLVGQDNMPFVGLAPMNAPEEWKAQRKEALNTIEAYLVLLYQVEEDAIIGTDNKKGILEFVSDFENVVRGSFWPDADGVAYLSKPTDITNVEFGGEDWGDNYYLIISTITLSCIRLFNAS